MTIIHRLPLSLKTALAFGVVLAALLAGMVLLLSWVMMHTFGDLQRDLAIQRLNRLVAALDYAATTLVNDVAENAIWDDTYEFAQGRNPTFLQDNFYEVPGVVQDFTIVGLLNLDGNLREASFVGSNGLEPGLPKSVAPKDLEPLAKMAIENEGAVGLIRTHSGGVLLAAGHGVHPTDNTGEPVGIFFYAQELDAEFLAELAELADVESLGLHNGESPTLKSKYSVVLDSARRPAAEANVELPHWTQSNASQIEAYAIIPSLTGSPIPMTATIGNEVFRTAVDGQWKIGIYSFVGGGILICTAILLLEIFVLRRLALLTSEMQRMAGQRDPTGRIEVVGEDEFAQVAAAANRMLDSIEESHRALSEHVEEIERFNRAMLGREERILELKQEVNALLTEGGRPPRYEPR